MAVSRKADDKLQMRCGVLGSAVNTVCIWDAKDFCYCNKFTVVIFSNHAVFIAVRNSTEVQY